MNIRHETEILETTRRDGDIDAVVVKISNTGDSGAVAAERYRHTIDHNLKRLPVGAQIIWADDIVGMKVVAQSTTSITVVFDTARAQVNLRIW